MKTRTKIILGGLLLAAFATIITVLIVHNNEKAKASEEITENYEDEIEVAPVEEERAKRLCFRIKEILPMRNWQGMLKMNLKGLTIMR